MIYTIGYARLKLADLKHIVTTNNMILIDVRARPYGRMVDFNRKKLEAALGPLYQWHGDTLGGKGQEINQRGIKAVAAIRGKHPLLMCIEDDPEHCHRHHAICAPYFPKAVHIFREELIQAGNLHAAIVANRDEYDICGSFIDHKPTLY